MKKLTVAILSIIYLGTSTGMNVQLHNCMGELANRGVMHNNSKNCGKCGMEKKDGKDNGCCNDEHKFFKNNSDQKVSESSFQPLQLVGFDLSVSFLNSSSNNFSSVTEESPVSNSPPRSHGVAVYIFKRTFLI